MDLAGAFDEALGVGGPAGGEEWRPGEKRDKDKDKDKDRDRKKDEEED